MLSLAIFFTHMHARAHTHTHTHTHSHTHTHTHTHTYSSNTGIHKGKQCSTPYIQYGPSKRQKSVHCKPVTSEWFTQQMYTKTFKHHQISVDINNTVCAKIHVDCFQTNKSTLGTTVQTNITGLDETPPSCTKHDPKPCPLKCIWWGSPGTVWSGTWSWAVCSELGNLLLLLFSTVWDVELGCVQWARQSFAAVVFNSWFGGHCDIVPHNCWRSKLQSTPVALHWLASHHLNTYCSGGGGLAERLGWA